MGRETLLEQGQNGGIDADFAFFLIGDIPELFGELTLVTRVEPEGGGDGIENHAERVCFVGCAGNAEINRISSGF